jgi:hypothetical protein
MTMTDDLEPDWRIADERAQDVAQAAALKEQRAKQGFASKPTCRLTWPHGCSITLSAACLPIRAKPCSSFSANIETWSRISTFGGSR